MGSLQWAVYNSMHDFLFFLYYYLCYCVLCEVPLVARQKFRYLAAMASESNSGCGLDMCNIHGIEQCEN
jgi:hypothetical protein